MLRLVCDVYAAEAEPLACAAQAVAGLCKLTGAQSGLFGILEKADSALPAFVIAQPAGAMDHASHQRYLSYADGEYVVDVLYQTIAPHAADWGAVRRERRLDCAAWYRSPWYNEILRPMRLDDCMYALGRLHDRYYVGVGLSRPAGTAPFGRREETMLSLVHRELAPLYRRVASGLLATPRTLSPSLKKTLGLLLQGLSEKQIAHRRDLSRHTIHDHVKQIYRHFGVGSRAELLARVASGAPRPATTTPTG